VRRCKQCDRDISHRAPQARYCENAKCQRERALAAGRASWLKTGEKQRAHRRAQYAEKRAQQSTVYIPCQVCGTEIVRKTVRTKWCSESCRTKARLAADPDLARRKMAVWRERYPERSRAYLLEWRTANKDRVLHYSKNATHKRRAQKAASAGTGISFRAWNRLVDRFQGRCAYCGLPPQPNEVLEQDHVVPLSRGGAHSEGNILPACDTCNVRKSDRLIVEWRLNRRVHRRSKRSLFLS
jgi:5-methylcytosine-specific restriction endonuclease McrA